MADPRRRLFMLALIPVAVVGLLAAVYVTRNPNAPGTVVELSGPMPRLEGPALRGGPIRPDLYQGKVDLVNFWASWCGPCRKEQPGLQRLWEEYRDRGVQVIGVNFRDDPAAALAYLDEFGVTYPSVRDDGLMAYRFEIPYLPATVLVGRDGQMRYRLLGAQEEAVLRGYLEELLAAPSG